MLKNMRVNYGIEFVVERKVFIEEIFDKNGLASFNWYWIRLYDSPWDLTIMMIIFLQNSMSSTNLKYS